MLKLFFLSRLIKNILFNNQILIFLNRKGYGIDLLCNNCKVKLKCLNCDVKLVYYKNSNHIICHHCGYKTTLKCLSCNGHDIIFKGWGVERIEEELNKLFPLMNIITITGNNKQTLDKIEDANIVIGCLFFFFVFFFYLLMHS